MEKTVAVRCARWVAFLLVGACAQASLMGADVKRSDRPAQSLPANFDTMRPVRTPRQMTLTVGQGEGDLQGKDDKVIQAAVDYLSRLGGGTVRLLPGTYAMRNAVYLRPGITLCGADVDDVLVEDVVLDGKRAANERLNGNFGGAAFVQYGNRWTFRNVVARNFNGDGFSFQVCDDVRFERCRSLNNADCGFHPGSGSQRPIFKNCVAKGNSRGLFWCWGVCDGLAEDCTLSENTLYGTSFGHRDTDNVVRRCTIVGCHFENGPKGKQQVAIRIGPEAARITLDVSGHGGRGRREGKGWLVKWATIES